MRELEDALRLQFVAANNESDGLDDEEIVIWPDGQVHAVVDDIGDLTGGVALLRAEVLRVAEPRWWITPAPNVVCKHCGVLGGPERPAPPIDDDAAWADLAEREHAPGCTWVRTRAVRIYV